MKSLGFLARLVIFAAVLALAACEQTLIETDASSEDEAEGWLVHIEFNGSWNPGEVVLATMWVQLNEWDERVMPWLELHLENPETLGTIIGDVEPGSGVDPRYRIHFDPNGTMVIHGSYPPDVCISGIYPNEEIEEEVLQGARRTLCIRAIRVIEVLPLNGEG
ncbi:MAG: hypothetical protein EA351_01430 [Gemmatimonadales bacterium]|nr:MAG: hypothetical protein EA351_01430 [Gemmatimonadales bacterium]